MFFSSLALTQKRVSVFVRPELPANKCIDFVRNNKIKTTTIITKQT